MCYSHIATDWKQLLSPFELVTHWVVFLGYELSGALLPLPYQVSLQPPEAIVLPEGQVATDIAVNEHVVFPVTMFLSKSLVPTHAPD